MQPERDFELLVAGSFSCEQVRTRWHPDLARRSDPGIDAGLDACWRAALERAARHGFAAPYDGRLCRLRPADVRLAEGVLHLAFGPCTYREHLGTNLNEAVQAEVQTGRLSEDVLASPTGVCAALVTADQQLVVARRSAATQQHAGYWHVVGGHPEQDRHLHDGQVDVFAAMRDEIVEELTCRPEDVLDLRCTGVVRDRRTFKPEVVFTARLRQQSAELKLRNDEHHELAFVANQASDLARRLCQDASSWVPVGRACLLLHGRLAFGAVWFSDVVDP
jgi:8-oxo-dGTP pyrophosphatase MutT (NUDIX family)